MRVLIVDNDSEMLENVARRLRDGFSIDIVTGKGDALDLLRQNDLHVVVACERLNDGSGLDLLSQTAKRWPETLRLFAASSDRLELLRGRLGPFRLFQTLNYPIDPGELGSILMLAQAAQAADADTTNVQHIVLGEDNVLQADTPAAVLAHASASAAPPSLAVARGAARPLPFTVASPAPPSASASQRKPLTRESLAQVHRPPVGSRVPAHRPVPEAAEVLPALAQLRSHLHGEPGGGFRPQRKPLIIGAAVLAVLIAGSIALWLGTGDSHDPDSAVQAPPKQARPASTTPAREALANRRATARAQRGQMVSPSEPQPARVPQAPDAASDTTNTAQAEAPAATSDMPPAETTQVTSEPAAPEPSDTAAPASEAAAHGSPTQTFGGRTLESSTSPAAVTSAPASGTSVPDRPVATRPTTNDVSDLPPVVREAKLVKRGELVYPIDAASRGTEGSVEIEFTVTATGRVTKAVVVEGTPAGVFDRAALSAVRHWRYEPRIEDGVPVDWRTTVRIEFKLDEQAR